MTALQLLVIFGIIAVLCATAGYVFAVWWFDRVAKRQRRVNYPVGVVRIRLPEKYIIRESGKRVSAPGEHDAG
jgi:hypothetical protein